MLFSVPDSTWWLVAAGATLFAIIGFQAIVPDRKELPEDLPEEWHAALDRWDKHGKVLSYGVVPLLLALTLGVNLLRPQPTPAILFMYSAVVVAFPLAFLPVRRRLYRSLLEHHRNPGAEFKQDRLAMTWIVAVIVVVICAAAAAIASSPYGAHRY